MIKVKFLAGVVIHMLKYYLWTLKKDHSNRIKNIRKIIVNKNRKNHHLLDSINQFNFKYRYNTIKIQKKGKIVVKTSNYKNGSKDTQNFYNKNTNNNKFF